MLLWCAVMERGTVRSYTPEQICAMILGRLKTAAELHFGDREVRDVVIAIPAYYKDAQRQARPLQTLRHLSSERSRKCQVSLLVLCCV